MPTLLSSSSSLLTGAILAGGHSSRFGSNKALFAPHGEPLISKVADLLRPLTGEVLVSASPAHAGTYDFLGLEIVEDLHPDSGPLGGLEALLQRCGTPWLLVLTCDMPFVDSDALLTIISHIRQPEESRPHDGYPRAFAWRRSDGSISPFPLLIEQDALAILQDRIRAGKLSMKGLLSAVDTCYITSPSDYLLSNINRPEDWTYGKFSKDNIANT